MNKIIDSINYGFAKMKENMQISLFATLLTLAVGVVPGGHGMGRSLLGILATIFLIIIRIGYNKMFLRMNDGEKPTFSEIFKEYPLFWKYLGLSILMPLAVLVGLVLLIIPGIIWAVRFSFAPLILVDTKIGPIAAMKESWAITAGNFWHLLEFWIVIGLINLLGMIVLGVGLLVSIPVSTFASIYVYRELTKVKAGVIPATVVPP